jgi:hypothetical protein
MRNTRVNVIFRAKGASDIINTDSSGLSLKKNG